MKKTIITYAATATVAMAACTPATEEENIFRYKVGDFDVVLLSEGQGEGDTGILLDAPAETIAPYLSENGSYPTATNMVLVRNGDHEWLIDTGYGATLFDKMATLGLEPKDVDEVLLTHLHGDHIGGMLREGAVAFPDATVRLADSEFDYWTNAGNAAAKDIFSAYGDAVRPIVPAELDEWSFDGTDGIFPIAAYGHTPGHTMFMVVSGGDKLLVWGDIAHAMAVQMPHPEISVRYDVDPDAARDSRRRVLEYVATNHIPVAGMHIPYPGIGTVERVGDGYKFTPAIQ